LNRDIDTSREQNAKNTDDRIDRATGVNGNQCPPRNSLSNTGCAKSKRPAQQLSIRERFRTLYKRDGLAVLCGNLQKLPVHGRVRQVTSWEENGLLDRFHYNSFSVPLRSNPKLF
jgi:hypothetical protein